MPLRKKQPTMWILIFIMIFLTISCNLLGQTPPEQEGSTGSEDVERMDENGTELDEAEQQEEKESDDQDSVTEEEGLSRENPIPLGTLTSVPGWDIQVLELLRGEEAAAMVNSGDRKFDPPPSGYEYALAKIFLRCTSMDEKAHYLGLSELFLTGSSHLNYSDRMDGWPAPEFLFEDMFSAEAVEGWIDAIIPVTEENLMVVLDFTDWDTDIQTTRFFELEEGASIVPSGAMFEQIVNDVGINKDQPASIGELMIMTEWDITVVSSFRGEEALSMLRQESPDYKGPEEGDEYFLLEVVIHYFNKQDRLSSVSEINFYTDVDGNTYRGRIRYPMQSEFTWINSIVFPGAAIEGWTIVSLPEGMTNPVIIFNPGEYTGSGEELRYFTIP